MHGRCGRTVILLALSCLLIVSCARNVITRQQWRARTPEQKELIIRSLLGGEGAADAKGGRGHRYTRSPDYYREEIDRRYSAGEQRAVTELWKELADKK